MTLLLNGFYTTVLNAIETTSIPTAPQNDID
jgi:hypothetical protein